MVSSVVDHDGADLAAGAEQLLDRGQVGADGERRAEHEHDRLPVEPAASSLSEANGVAPWPSCMARRLRAAWSASTTATAT